MDAGTDWRIDYRIIQSRRINGSPSFQARSYSERRAGIVSDPIAINVLSAELRHRTKAAVIQDMGFGQLPLGADPPHSSRSMSIRIELGIHMKAFLNAEFVRKEEKKPRISRKSGNIVG